MTEHMPNNSGNEHAPYEAHGGGGSGIDEAEARALIESYHYLAEAAARILIESYSYENKAGVEAIVSKAYVEGLSLPYLSKAAVETLIATYGFQTQAEVEALMAPGKWEEVFEEVHTGIKLIASAAWRHEMGTTVLRLRGEIENTEALKPAGVAAFKLPSGARPTSVQHTCGAVYTKLGTGYTIEIATTGIVTVKPSAELPIGNAISLDGLSISLT